jgi:hypothetical protein
VADSTHQKVSATAAMFTSDADAGTGTYRFRARMRNTANAKASSYSPPAVVKVS